MYRRIVEINRLANMFGNFYNAYLESGTSCNNGYNCRHPGCGEIQEGVGLCHSFSCPFGYEADREDFENEDIDTRGYSYEEGRFIVLNIPEKR